MELPLDNIIPGIFGSWSGARLPTNQYNYPYKCVHYIILCKEIDRPQRMDHLFEYTTQSK